MRQSASLSTAARVSRPVAARSSFHTSSARRALSESDHTDDHPDRPGTIDHHKEEQLKKQKAGKGHWVKELASNSEAAVKADRDEIDATQENIEKLQEETEEMLEGKNEGPRKAS